MIISISSLICMSISLIIMIGVILVGLFILKSKYSSIWRPFFLGSITFLFFVLFLEQIVHSFVLRNTFITTHIWIYSIYAAFSATVFEEFGRLLSMNYLYKKEICASSGLIYGWGYASVEAIVVGVISILTSIIIAFSINSGTVNFQTPGITEKYGFLMTTPSYLYLISGYERIIAIFLQVSLSIIMWKGVSLHKKDFVIYAFLAHFIFDFISVIFNNYFGILITELFITFLSILFGFFSFKIYRRN